MKKILVVDDEIELLETIRDYFESLDYIVYTADNASKALEQITHNPDIIVLDVSMPLINGFQLCEEFRKKITCPIIFLSAKTDEASRLYGLNVGGDDYLIKPISLKELSTRIFAHIRREARNEKPDLLRFSNNILVDFDQKLLIIDNQTVLLTKVEFDIVELLSKHPRKIYSKAYIYDFLWQFDKTGNDSIISEHIRRIRKKISEHTNHEIILTVWGSGYKWIG